MKSLKLKHGLHLVYLVILLINLIWSIVPAFSQGEGDAEWRRQVRFYGERAYPYSFIPSGAFENAVAQKELLLQSHGYQFTIPHWDLIGPMPLEAWDIMSGRANHIIYDTRDSGGQTIYITGEEGGVWKTTDAGLTWQNKSGNLPILSAGALAIDFDRNILYFGTPTPTIFFGEGLGMRIYKSTDDGISWFPIGNGLVPGSGVSQIAIDPIYPHSKLFAATFHGLFKTTDGGNYWFKVIPSDTSSLICTDVCFSPSGNKVYAIGNSYNYWVWPFNGIGLWRSLDGGNNFEPIGSGSGFPHPPGNVGYGTGHLAVSQASEDTVYILNYDNDHVWNPLGCWGNSVYLYRSINGGSNFTVVRTDISCIPYHAAVVKCSPFNANIVFMGNEDLYRSIDGGASWSPCIAGYCSTHADLMALDFNPTDANKIAIGNDGGIFRSDNLGDSWASKNQNLSLSRMTDLAGSTYDPNFVAAGLWDFYGYEYKYSGTDWRGGTAGVGDGWQMLASPFKSLYFAGATIGSFDYSHDGINFSGAQGYHCNGSSATYMTNHPTEPGVMYLQEYINPDNQNVPEHVYIEKSTDYGEHWNCPNYLRDFDCPLNTIGKRVIPYHPLAISPSNPNVMIMDFTSDNEYWHFAYTNTESRLIKSTNGGVNWIGIDNNTLPIVRGGQNGTPDRAFTNVVFDPVNENIVYMTTSGYYYPNQDQGHVFKSIDGGYHWTNISGDLIDIPVNQLVIHYTGETTKDLIIGTDVGVFVSGDDGISWRGLANGLPNTSVTRLDLNRLSDKLRAATWGRGAFEFDLGGPIYVPDNLYITNQVNLTQQIIVCNGGKLILGHSGVPGNFTINFNLPGGEPGIVVKDGGRIEALSGNQIDLTSTGHWNGIVFECGGYGELSNCVFENTTSTGVMVDYSIGAGCATSNYIVLNNCIFNGSDVIVNSDEQAMVYIQNSQFMNDANLNINFSDAVLVTNNTFNNGGISASNSNAVITKNTINNAPFGITLDNCTAPVLEHNTISNSGLSLYMFTSSPTMLDNTINRSNVYDMSINNDYLSFPRMRPASSGEGTLIWDAGLNHITAAPANGIAIYYQKANADIDGGINFINAGNKYLDGWLYPVPLPIYPATGNCWDGGNPDPNKFSLHDADNNPITVVWNPINCTPPFASIENEYETRFASVIDEIPYSAAGTSEAFISSPLGRTGGATLLDPPQPYIINRGNGHFDTIKVTNGNLNLSPNEALYSSGVQQELQNNFTGAVNTYKQLIQNYHDSVTAIKAAIRILPCTDKMTNDTGRYTALGNYYSNVMQSYPADTLLRKVVNELSHKCLVRKGEYPPAITAYETDIEHTTDTLEILCYRLNIVETYMLFSQGGGNAPQFTGKYSNLKPASKLDGFRMIRELLHLINAKKNANTLPKEFALSQNYPNPFNAQTKINFALPNKANVTMKVYDVLGRLVRTILDNEFKEAGYHTVMFDGTNLASGIYFYRIEADKFISVKKMVIIK